MKVDIIVNGQVRLVLTPENDIDRATMKLLGNQTLEGTVINQATAMLDKQVPEGLIIGIKKENATPVVNVESSNTGKDEQEEITKES